MGVFGACMDQSQYQGINPLVYFPPFPPFPVLPTTACGNDNDVINVVNYAKPSPVPVTEVTTPEYTATLADYFLCVTHAGQVVITLPTGITGTVYIIKDCDGNASPTTPIIVQGTGQNVDIGTATIDTSFGSISVIFNGEAWSIV